MISFSIDYRRLLNAQHPQSVVCKPYEWFNFVEYCVVNFEFFVQKMLKCFQILKFRSFMQGPLVWKLKFSTCFNFDESRYLPVFWDADYEYEVKFLKLSGNCQIEIVHHVGFSEKCNIFFERRSIAGQYWKFDFIIVISVPKIGYKTILI